MHTMMMPHETMMRALQDRRGQQAIRRKEEEKKEEVEGKQRKGQCLGAED